jgi:hypothetical protein
MSRNAFASVSGRRAVDPAEPESREDLVHAAGGAAAVGDAVLGLGGHWLGFGGVLVADKLVRQQPVPPDLDGGWHAPVVDDFLQPSLRRTRMEEGQPQTSTAARFEANPAPD